MRLACTCRLVCEGEYWGLEGGGGLVGGSRYSSQAKGAWAVLRIVFSVGVQRYCTSNAPVGEKGQQ